MKRRGAAFNTSLIATIVWLGLTTMVAAQAPIRIGASLSQTGSYAAPGQNQLRGYRLCVKHANDKGGVLARRLELHVEDDRSQASTATAIYEKLITEARVDAILGPYYNPIVEAAADVAERHKMPMVVPTGNVRSIYTKGRRFIFTMSSLAEMYLEGLVDMAATRGLRTLALIYEDALFGRALAQGGVELARKRGLSVVLQEGYPPGTTDFAGILAKVRAANPDVLAAGTYFDDAVALTRQQTKLGVNPKMFAVTVGGDFPEFYQILGRNAEFVYGPSQWEAELVTLRAGGLIPIARQYPGAREFVESHRKEFPGAELSYHTAAAYGGCQLLVEAIRRAGSLDAERVRGAIVTMDLHTVYGAFKVDQDGVQVGHRMVMFQWQDGKKVIVWPPELAPGAPRFPTPPWNQRP